MAGAPVGVTRDAVDQVGDKLAPVNKSDYRTEVVSPAPQTQSRNAEQPSHEQGTRPSSIATVRDGRVEFQRIRETDQETKGSS